MLIGITGTLSSGKTKLAKIFEELGYTYYSFRAEENFEEKIVPVLNKNKNQVIDSLHTIEQIEKIIFNNSGFLFYIDIDIKDRYFRWAQKMKHNPSEWMYYENFLNNEYDKKIKTFSRVANYKINNMTNFSELMKLKKIEELNLNQSDLERAIKSVLRL